MKPIHEKEWHISKGVVLGGLRPVCDDDGTPICAVIREEAEPIISAATDMARALLLQACTNRVGQSCWCSTTSALVDDELHEFRCSEARAALRKAGVMP